MHAYVTPDAREVVNLSIDHHIVNMIPGYNYDLVYPRLVLYQLPENPFILILSHSPLFCKFSGDLRDIVRFDARNI